MKAVRAMVLVSGDPDSIRLGSEQIFMALEKEFIKLGIQDEISLSMISDVDRQDASPLVIVYPEAVIYGPVTVADIPYLVEEHLYKGRIASNLVANSTSHHALLSRSCSRLMPTATADITSGT